MPAVSGGRWSRRRRAPCSGAGRGAGLRAGTRRPTPRPPARRRHRSRRTCPGRRTASRRPGHLAHPGDVLARRRAIADLDREAVLERLDDGIEVVERHVAVERRVQGLRDEPLDDPLLGRLVADRLELDLAGGRWRRPRRGRTPAATPSGSPSRTARLRAAASRTSVLATLTRTDTPERWLISGERRARWVSSATISSMNGGTTTAGGRPRPGSAASPGGRWPSRARACAGSGSGSASRGGP